MEDQNSQVSRRARQHYSREEKQKHLQDQAGSGLTAAAYCRQQGLRYGNFLNWQRQGVVAVPSFRPLELVAGSSHPESLAEVRFSRGQVLLIHPGCSEKMASCLVRVLS